MTHAFADFPGRILRWIAKIIVSFCYRIKIIGGDEIPVSGGVLLAPNHVSFIDAIILTGMVKRPIRFIVDHDYYEKFWIKPFMKALKCIPISSTLGPKPILRALREAGRFLDEGEVVCIFPEGQLTRTGNLNPFKRGLERIIRDRQAVIVPAYLDRLWGSVFSREGGRYFFKWPKAFPLRLSLVFGTPLPAGTPLYRVRQEVQAAGTRAWEARRIDSKPLHYGFIRQAHKNPRKLLLADAKGNQFSTRKTLVASIALARKLSSLWRGEDVVGILLPPSIGGVLANFAVTLSGRTVVNLNYTLGISSLMSCLQQADVKTVITNREFLTAVKISDLSSVPRVIYVEDWISEFSLMDRVKAFCVSLFPARWIERACGAQKPTSPDDLATIIFSSGSTGDPKGIMLSHFNIDCNTEALGQIVRVEKNDRLLGILPFFHSFGYAALWFSVKEGIGMPLHPKPLDATTIGTLVHKYRVTILIATPTFLQFFMRRCSPSQFGSLRFVMTGAEKLSERLALAFEDHFGIKPLEGYGATECSPAIAASVPDFRSPGFFQSGSRRGFVGQALPGISLRVVDADTHEILAPGKPGLLQVKGPNIMQGYVKNPALTADVLRDGWYQTGDIVILNDDGFLKITDRLSRFSKIAGEMVPHGKVEDLLHELSGAVVKTFCVTAVDDDHKGEALVVFHLLSEDKIPPLVEALHKTDLPKIFIPRPDHYRRLEQLPILGTGKIDLRALKKLAQFHFGPEAKSQGTL